MASPLGLAIWHVATPVPTPATTAIHRITEIHSILVEVTDGEHNGCGYASVFTPHQAHAVHALVRDLWDVYRFGDPNHPERIHRAALQRLNFVGRTGIALFALAALDTAMWDLKARRAETSLSRLLGASNDRLPVYATGGWLDTPVSALVDEVVSTVARGYGGVKIKVGRPDWRDDLRRLEAVREAIGDDVALMADANQGWGVSTAVLAGHAFRDLGLEWLEEPVDADDIASTADVRRRVPVRIAAGETRFGADGVGLLATRAVDVLMPDLAHVGGITAFLETARTADQHNVDLSSHTFTEFSLPLVAAAPSGTWVEHVPGWWDPLFDRPAGPPEQGMLRVPEGLGSGVTFSEQVKHDYGC